MAFVQADLKQGKSKKQSQEMRKLRNANKKVKAGTSSSSKKQSATTYGKRVSHRKNPHQMNDKTRKIFNEAKDSYAIPQATQGFYSGWTSSTTGAKLPVNKKVKKTIPYKVANFVGQAYGYLNGYKLFGKAFSNPINKVLGTKTGIKTIGKLAGKKYFQNAAKKTLVKSGQNATKKAVVHASRKRAKKFLEGVARNAASDATVGTVMDSNVARSEGYKPGSKEWKEFMAASAAANLVFGAGVEVAPIAFKSVFKGSKKKTIEQIVNGKVKKVKVEKTYKDFSAENAARKKAEIIKESKKTLDDAKRKYDVAKKNNINVEEARKVYRKAQSDYTKVIKDSAVNAPKAEPPKYNVGQKASANTYRSVNEPARAGRATKIEHPYKGETPKVTGNQKYSVPELPKKTLDDVEFLKNKLSRSDLKKEINNSFGQPRVVSVKNVEFGSSPYRVRLNKKVVGKIVSSKYKTENLAILGNLDDIVANGKYVGSGEYIPHGTKQKLTVRFDYFETPIKIDGKDYIVRYDVEVFPNINNYKSHDVVHDIKEIDLLPRSAADVGPEPTATNQGKGLFYNVSENVQDVNKNKNLSSKSATDVGPEPTATNIGKGLDDIVQESKQNVNGHKNFTAFNHEEAFKDPDFVKYIGEKSGGNVPNLAKENGISVNEQTKRLYDEYVKDKSSTRSTIGAFDVEGRGIGITSPEFKAFEESVENAQGFFDKAYRAGVSGQRELERMAKVSGRTTVVDSTQAVRSASGTVDYILRHGITDHAGNVVNKTSYAKLIKNLPRRHWDEFNTYAQHLHNIDRWKQDVPVFKQTTAEESKKIVDDILKSHPEFEAHGKEITDWWNQFTKTWLLDTGQVSKEAYEAMLEKYPHYIPTYRVGKTRGAGGGTGNRINPGKAVRSAKGGVSDVIPLEDNFLAEIDRIVKTTKKNDLYLDIIEELKTGSEALRQFGVVVNDGTKIDASDISGMLDAVERTGLREVNEKVAMITAYKDGKAVSAFVNRNMLDALKLLNDNIGSQHIRFLRELGTKITNPLKAGITGYNPLFAVANAMRDLPTLYLQSEHSMFKTTTGLFKATGQMMKGGEIYQKYLAMGGKSAGYYHQGKGFKDAMGMTKNPIKRTWEGMERFLSVIGEGTETIPRLTEFINSVNKYGDSPEGIRKALNDAAEVTVNFARSGPATKTVDGWVLYLNAAVQGLDKFARTLKAHPIRTAGRGLALITAPYAALMAVNWENPNYQDLTERTKQNYYCIPNLYGEKDANGYAMTFIKIPINREYGAILASSLDVIAGYVGGEENPWKGYGETIATNFMPPSLTTDNVLAPVQINLPNNRDFAGRTIVPGYLEKASPKYQYDGGTSGAARGIADIANHLADNSKIANTLIPEALKSPMRVDYLIDSYGGYLGQVAQSASNGYVKDGKTFFSNVVADPFKQRFSADPRFSSGVMQDFYDAKDKAETAKTDDKIIGKKNSVNTVKARVYNEISATLSDLAKEERAVLANRSLSKEVKDERIKQIRAKRNEIARNATTKVKTAEREYDSAPNFAVLDKNVKEKWKGSGIDKETFAKLYNARTVKEGQGKSIANRIKMANAGGTYKEVKAIDPKMSKDSWKRAQNLANLGITAKQAQKIAKKANADGNNSISKAEMMAYLARTNYSNYEKAYIFAAFCPRVKYNPYW